MLIFNCLTQIAQEVHVRIIDLPIVDRLRDLRQFHLNNLIHVNGVVTRRGLVHPILKYSVYECGSCGALSEKMRVYGGMDFKPNTCTMCNEKNVLRFNQARSEYSNFQMLTLQETPGSVPAGRVPRYKQVTLLDDLVDTVRPGEEIDMVGIYLHNPNLINRDKSGCPVFTTLIEANSIQKKNSSNSTFLSEEDKRRIKELSSDPQVRCPFLIHPRTYQYSPYVDR